MRERAALGGGYAWYNDFTQEDSQGNVVQTSFGNGVKDSSGWTFAFSDLYGTPRRVCDASKNTVRMTEFTPYGLPYLGMASGAQGGFTGHTFDDVSGFHRAAYRNYSPVLGRWTSREPSGIDGPNTYWYGSANPARCVDLTGLSVTEVVDGFGGWLDDAIMGRRGDWFDKFAEYAGRCFLAPAIASGLAAFGTAVATSELFFAFTPEWGPSFITAAKALGGSHTLVIAGDVASGLSVVTGFFTDSINGIGRAYTDRMMGENPDHECL